MFKNKDATIAQRSEKFKIEMQSHVTQPGRSNAWNAKPLPWS